VNLFDIVAPLVDLKFKKVFVGLPIPGHDYWKAVLYGLECNMPVNDVIDNVDSYADKFSEYQGIQFTRPTRKWLVHQSLKDDEDVIRIIGNDEIQLIGRTG
jgi:hypothetical protein